MQTEQFVIAKLCRSLNRLTCRLLRHTFQPGYRASHDQHGLAAIKPRPFLLTGMAHNMAVSGAIMCVLRVQEHFLAYADGTLPFEPLAACKALQHLANDTDAHWSPAVLRFAAAIGYEPPAIANTDGRVTLHDVDTFVVQAEIHRLMSNPRIAWEPRPSMPGWQQGRVDGVVIALLDVGEKACWLRWVGREQTEPGWCERHGSEAASKLAAERRVAASDRAADGVNLSLFTNAIHTSARGGNGARK